MLATTASASAASASNVWQWKPQAGDKLVVDTSLNVGYLIHPSGEYLPFVVVTGQRRTVRYIGRTYFAATPTRTWIAKSVHKKGDKVTFGPTGKFIRLYYENESTPYGIHGHAQSEMMLSDEDRYRSMGCVIVSEQILDIIERSFMLNDDQLVVMTTSSTADIVPELELKETIQ